MSSNYFRYADAIVLVYSCTDTESKNSLISRWIDNCERYCKRNVLYYVLGNKIDDVSNICVDKHDAYKLCRDLPVTVRELFQISVKTKANFDVFINTIVDDLVHFYHASKILATGGVGGTDTPDSITMRYDRSCEEEDEQSKKGCAC